MMKQTLLIFGASALMFTAPLAAKPDKGHGHGAQGKHGTHATMDHSKHGKGKMYAFGRACPPGLSKHEDHCMPHGQFKKRYGTGQRFPASYGNLWSYNQIPVDLRSRYGFNQNYRYYYGDGYLYQVNPRTMLIQQVVNAIMR